MEPGQHEQMMAQMTEKMAQMRTLMDEMTALMGGEESGEQQMQAGYAKARGPAPGGMGKMGGM